MKIQSAMTLQNKTFGVVTLAIAIGALVACSSGSAPSTGAAVAAAGTNGQSPSPQAATNAPSSPAADFPSGTELGDLGLPVYPTPPDNISPHDAGTNEVGGKHDSVMLSTQQPFDTVLAWYKAHMPTGSLVSSMNPKHAEFHLGDDEKVTRMVMLDNITEGHTRVIIMMKTEP